MLNESMPLTRRPSGGLFIVGADIHGGMGLLDRFGLHIERSAVHPNFSGRPALQHGSEVSLKLRAPGIGIDLERAFE